MGVLLQRMVAAAGRRPVRVLAVVTVLPAPGAPLPLGLPPRPPPRAPGVPPGAATSTLVSKRSDAYRATETYRQKFGDHAILVLVRGELSNLVLTSNLDRRLGLEGCLSGNKPANQAAPGGAGSPCDKLSRSRPVQVVYG